MPWRAAPGSGARADAYAVLLSEVMLQQTRVETVVPYFERFLSRWPTFEALAAADEQEVLAAWAGLGYYSRARNLLRAAREAAAAGGLPTDVEGLRKLPGLGPYTAGAIASIAYGRPEPAIDGNVERVVTRRIGEDADPRSAAGRSAIEGFVRALLGHGAPDELNQALMELGATVCSPRTPACHRCPWAARCVARRTDRVAALPNKAKKAPPKPVRAVAGLWTRSGRVLCGRRPPGLLGGLYEPISCDLADDEPALPALVEAFRTRAGVVARPLGALGELVHVFTHRRMTLHVFEVDAAGEPVASGGYEALAWVDPAAPDVGLSKLAVRALAFGATPTLGLSPRR